MNLASLSLITRAVGAIVLAGLIALVSWLPRIAAHAEQTPRSVGEVTPGNRIESLVNGIRLVGRKTVVTVLKASDCPACSATLDAYRLICSACSAHPGQSRTVALSMDQPTDLKKYLKQQRVPFDSVYSFPRTNTLDIDAPSLFTLDGDGRIVAVWRGPMTSKDVAAVQAWCARAD